MHRILVIALCLISTPVLAKPLMSLVPPVAENGGDLIFGADGPRKLTADHPLYGKVAVGPVEGMPEKIGGFLVQYVKRTDFDDAVRVGLQSANMLAADGAQAKFRLSVTWGLLDAPQKIGLSAHALSRISYKLSRVDSGQVLFAREIVTESRSTGGDAVERLKGTARFAIMTNIASAIACVDKAAFGNAPEDCALKPNASFKAPKVPLVIYAPRF